MKIKEQTKIDLAGNKKVTKKKKHVYKQMLFTRG